MPLQLLLGGRPPAPYVGSLILGGEDWALLSVLLLQGSLYWTMPNTNITPFHLASGPALSSQITSSPHSSILLPTTFWP